MREKQLKKLNNALVNSLSSISDDEPKIDWKAKYEEEVKRSHLLEKKLMESSYKTKNIEPNPERKIESLKNSRQSNLKKMDELIENMMKRKGSIENIEPITH